MKLKNINKLIPILGMVILVASSCDKVKKYDPLGDAGATYVKITGGGTPGEYEKKSIDFVSTPSIVNVDVQRMVPNAAELNKTMTVVIRIDTAAVSFFNRDTAASNPDATNPDHVVLVKIPNSWYSGTVNNPKAGGEDGTFTMTFAPGEFAKNLEILIPDATLLDPSTTYGIGLTIESVDAGGNISVGKSKIIGIGAKNIYDGIYSVVSGFVQRYSAPGVPTTGDALNGPLGPSNPDIEMVTVSANCVSIAGIVTPVGFTWATGAGIGGIDGIKLCVDPATNISTITSALNATLTNWAGHTNDFNPATRTFRLAFRWNPASTTREYEVVLKYKKPR